jgi:LDH2 family malate/lactate/ureidoglycolate dehydrogenase
MNITTSQRFAVDELHGFAVKALVAAGLLPGHAATVADALVQADCRGAVSHGLIRLPFLIARLTDGGANKRPELRIITEAPAMAVLDADAALGPIAAAEGMRLAIAKAREAGVGVTTVRNSDFIGTCAHSAMLALDAGMIGVTWTNGHPGMAPWGGRVNGIGNNPLAFAIPGGSGAPVVLDIAMSVVAGGKVRHAAKTGREIPEGWIVDSEGRDTRRPEDFPTGGALLALGHKGYGLAVVGEVLGGVLAGAAILGGIPQWFTATAKPVGNGHFHMALDLARFTPPDQFAQRMDEMREMLHRVARRPGVEEILLPGEAAERREKTHRSQGINIPEAVVADLIHLSRKFGLEAPEALGPSVNQEP